jgi:hypothetical protein
LLKAYSRFKNIDLSLLKERVHLSVRTSMKTFSARWELIPLDVQKLIRSFLLSLSGVVAYFLMVLIDYEVKKFSAMDISEELKIGLAIFAPFLINALRKWASEHDYKNDVK